MLHSLLMFHGTLKTQYSGNGLMYFLCECTYEHCLHSGDSLCPILLCLNGHCSLEPDFLLWFVRVRQTLFSLNNILDASFRVFLFLTQTRKNYSLVERALGPLNPPSKRRRSTGRSNAESAYLLSARTSRSAFPGARNAGPPWSPRCWTHPGQTSSI